MDITMIHNIRDVHYENENDTNSILITCDMDGISDGVIMSVASTDTEDYKITIWANALAGVYGTIGPAVPYVPTVITQKVESVKLPVSKKDMARTIRNEFIKATDPLTIIDYTIENEYLSDEQRKKLFAVRLEFKRWPDQKGWPDIPFPEVPAWLSDELKDRGYFIPVWPRVKK